MSQRFGIRCKVIVAGSSAVMLLGMGLSMVASAASAEQQGSSAPADARPGLQAQLKNVDAGLASERTRNTELQAQVARMEQQNADRGKLMQQRDEEIAALQKKLRAADVPASSGSTGP